MPPTDILLLTLTLDALAALVIVLTQTPSHVVPTHKLLLAAWGGLTPWLFGLQAITYVALYHSGILP